MSEKEQIIEELKKKIEDKDEEEQKLLLNLCMEILDEYDKESVKGVSNLLQNKLVPFKKRFNAAYDRLSEKMGFRS